MTILVVDDNEANRYQLEVLFHSKKFDVITAVNGTDALAKARENPPDLIVSDILMPGMDGFSLCRAWNEDDRLRSIPFIFYTATYTDEHDRQFALSLGAEQFIVKPEEPEIFLQHIQESLVRVQSRTAASKAAAAAPREDDSSYLKEYNIVLIRKLEAKMTQLEDVNRQLTNDITERKKVEEALREALKVKTAFTSMVSHELRTPLCALKESVSLVEGGMMGKVTEDQKKILEMAKSNIDRLSRLISQILDFQALETGKMVFHLNDNDINKTVTEVFELMNILAKEKGLAIFLDLDKGLPRIRFDADRISQVLLNLVDNSLKLTAKGRVTISTKRVNGSIEVSVKDTGPGINEKDMPRLFREYEQLVRRTGGAGLGLAICLEIIKSHGGKISAESTVGQGTTMRFTLPIQSA